MQQSLIIEATDLYGQRPADWDRDRVIVLVGGCFDIIHYGHLTFLKKAKELGTTLVVALESDEFIMRSKKRDPFHTHRQRGEVLTHLRSVDAVLMLPVMRGESDYRRLVEWVKPAVIAVTEHDPVLEQKRIFAKQVGGRVEVVTKHLEGLSSSSILKYAHIMYD